MHPHQAPTSPLRVALLGLGTVGKAVATALIDPAWQAHLVERGLTPPQLVAVGVREPERDRGLVLPSSVRVVDDLEGLCGAEDVDVVIELIGGLEAAESAIARALSAGHGVVTANKALLAASGAELEAAARTSGSALRFEAAVAGGVPVLAPLVADLAANRIDSLRGIVNGTTNEILTRMAEAGRTYEDVLVDCQAQGIAERDPSADVEGRDAAAKLVILTRLAFGGWPRVSEVRLSPPAVDGESLPGITGVRPAHLARAADLGLTIKLVARVARMPAGGLRGAVTTMAVRRSSPIGATDGVANIVEVDGTPIGRVSFRGPGAGGEATSSAVLADLLALARGGGSTWGHLPAASSVPFEDDLEAEHAWLVVLDRSPLAGPLAGLGDLAVIQGDGAFVARPMPLGELARRLASIGDATAVLPVLGHA